MDVEILDFEDKGEMVTLLVKASEKDYENTFWFATSKADYDSGVWQDLAKQIFAEKKANDAIPKRDKAAEVGKKFKIKD